MAESARHRAMKAAVRKDLERECYEVVEEPLSPSGGRATWSSYRPDLLGYRAEGGEEELVLVECETRPEMGRFLSKNDGSVWFQPFLFGNGSVRRILAVPRGRLGRVDLRLREKWEIWVVGPGGSLEKVPAKGERAK